MSHKGTSNFVVQRASAVFLVPLTIWLLFNIVVNVGADYASARAWLAQPINGLLFGAFVVIGAMHMRIGMAEIIIDYIDSWLRDVLLFLNWIVAIAVFLATIWSIYTISFAG